jgi:hypothetical protein
MLLTDKPIIEIENLVDHETAILETARVEAINLTVKISLATDEVGLQLQSRFPQLGLVNIGLQNVAVTPALRLWTIFHTLEIVYRDAYHNQLNDRYKAKWNEYKNLSSFAWGLLFRIGIGTVIDPIPQAAHPQLTLVPGVMPAAKYFVQVAWRNATDAEGRASQMTAIDVPSGSALVVSAVNPPANAVSWNVYVGTTPDSLFLQNTTPLSPTDVWLAPDFGLVTSGPQPGDGQEPAFLTPGPRILLRG